MTDVEYARAFFEKDYFATEAAGIVIEEAAPGHALVSCVTERRHKLRLRGRRKLWKPGHGLPEPSGQLPFLCPGRQALRPRREDP